LLEGIAMLLKLRARRWQSAPYRLRPAHTRRLRPPRPSQTQSPAPPARQSTPAVAGPANSRRLRSPIQATLLEEISDSLTREPRLDVALEGVLARCLDATGSSLAAVHLRGPTSASAPLEVVVDRSGRSRLCSAQRASLQSLSNVGRAVAAPIANAQASAGVLWLERAHSQLDREEWQALANTLAAKVAQALERRRSEAELAERTRLARLFAEVSVALTSSSPLSECLDRCAQAVRRQLDASLVRIWLQQEDAAIPRVAAIAGHSTELAEIARLLCVEAEVLQGVRERRPVSLVSAGPASGAECGSLSAFVAHPLLFEHRLVGALSLLTHAEPTSAALAALTPVADAIALGIQRKLARRLPH
jgi:transcriptional regulator with GAF, ATPase, and Fis domain